MSWKAIGAVIALASAVPAHAQSVEDFYRNRTITILVGFTAGGGYDLYARLLGRHMGRHVPGSPTIVVQNMPGAGSLKATQFVYSVAPRDGTVLATVSRGMVTEPLLNDAKFDATQLSWLGSITSETSVCATWHTSPVKTWPDMFAQDFTLGGSATGADPDTFALILRNVLGAKVKLVTGYPGGNDVNLAMERGEVGGRGSNSWASWKSTKPHWLAEKKIFILVQIALRQHPELAEVPLMTELATNEDDRKVLAFLSADTGITRAFVTTPDTPRERVAALRRAFDATMKDPLFLAEAEKAGMDISAVSGEDSQKVADSIANTEPAVLARARAILEN